MFVCFVFVDSFCHLCICLFKTPPTLSGTPPALEERENDRNREKDRKMYIKGHSFRELQREKERERGRERLERESE